MTRIGVATWLVDGAPSGASTRLRELIQAAAPQLQGGESLVLLGGHDLPTGPGIEHHAVPLGPAPALRRQFAEARVLKALVPSLRLDVLDQPFLPLAARLACPVVTTVHDLRDLHGWRRRLVPRVILRSIYRRQLRRAATVLTPSEFVAGELRENELADGPIVVPGGTRVQPPTDASRGSIVFHLGHLEPRKNLEVLIEALAKALPTEPDLELVLAGQDGGRRTRLERLARDLDVAGRVHFLGSISDTAAAELYRTCRLVTVPSRCEGFGLVALEGLAYGAPVAVASGSSLPEVVGDAGVVLDPDDVDGWAKAFVTPTGDHATARERAATFSWDHAATRWLEALRRSIP